MAELRGGFCARRHAAVFTMTKEVRRYLAEAGVRASLPGPQTRGTGGTHVLLSRDEGHPPGLPPELDYSCLKVQPRLVTFGTA